MCWHELHTGLPASCRRAGWNSRESRSDGRSKVVSTVTVGNVQEVTDLESCERKDVSNEALKVIEEWLASQRTARIKAHKTSREAQQKGG